MQSLLTAGYDYSVVRDRINTLLKGTPEKFVDDLVREVIKWGNSDKCKKRLTVVGYDYNAVQKRVNSLLS